MAQGQQIVRDNSVKPRHYGGGEWKRRKLEKGARASRESGKKKGLVPPSLARYMARSNRSHKHPGYAAWDAKCDGSKIKWNKA